MIIFITLIVLSLFYNPHLLVGAQYINVDDHQHHSHDSIWNTFCAGLFVVLLIFVFYVFYIYFDRYQQRRSAHETSDKAQRGLDPSTLETFPVFWYSEVSGLGLDKAPSSECAVCLSPFQKDEKVRKLPKCQHVFHLECLNRWLAGHTTCPLCRAELAPRPDDSSRTGPDCVEGSGSGSRVEVVRETVDDVV